MDRSSILLLIVVISELVALYLIWRIWKSDDYLGMKIALSVLAIIPVVGTLGVLWIIGFPHPAPSHLIKRGGLTDTTFTNRLDDARDNTESIYRSAERFVEAEKSRRKKLRDARLRRQRSMDRQNREE